MTTLTRTKKKDRYTVDKIVEIISEYKIYKESIAAYRDERTPSVGIAQYGIESVMPRGNTVSSQVEQTVISLSNMPRIFAVRATDMKYIEDRWYRIEDELDAMVLQLRLSGTSTREIAMMIGCSQRGVQRIIRHAAETIKGEHLIDAVV